MRGVATTGGADVGGGAGENYTPARTQHKHAKGGRKKVKGVRFCALGGRRVQVKAVMQRAETKMLQTSRGVRV